jgi:hypothetical protein
LGADGGGEWLICGGISAPNTSISTCDFDLRQTAASERVIITKY